MCSLTHVPVWVKSSISDGIQSHTDDTPNKGLIPPLEVYRGHTQFHQPNELHIRVWGIGRLRVFILSLWIQLFQHKNRKIALLKATVMLWMSNTNRMAFIVNAHNNICSYLYHRCWIQPWWRHQMETFSALLALCARNSPVPVNSPHKGQWHGALMFSLICAWINGWVNNRKAGDLKPYCAHYDVTVMNV